MCKNKKQLIPKTYCIEVDRSLSQKYKEDVADLDLHRFPGNHILLSGVEIDKTCWIAVPKNLTPTSGLSVRYQLL